MSNTRVANRYAKPIIALAEERKILEKVKDDMLSFSTLCKENRDFSLFLKTPIIPHLRKAEVLNSMFSGSVNELTLQAFMVIARKNREDMLEEVADQFLRMYKDAKGLADVSLVSSSALTDAQLKGVEELAAKLTGKKPIMETEIDPELIGGFILKAGDRQIDESISGKLKDIKIKLQTR